MKTSSTPALPPSNKCKKFSVIADSLFLQQKKKKKIKQLTQSKKIQSEFFFSNNTVSLNNKAECLKGEKN